MIYTAALILFAGLLALEIWVRRERRRIARHSRELQRRLSWYLPEGGPEDDS